MGDGAPKVGGDVGSAWQSLTHNSGDQGDRWGTLLTGGIPGVSQGIPGFNLGHAANVGILQPLHDMFSSKGADSSAPPAPPTRATANQVAIDSQLSREGQMRRAGTTLTGGAGLTDAPSTASTVLLGS